VTTREALADYEPLAAQEFPVVIMALEDAASLEAIAMELAVIDCGRDADAGLAILKEIKRHRTDVPVIFLTDASSEDVVLQAFKLGAREYFRKPVLREELVATVVKILQFKQKKPLLLVEEELAPLFRLPSNLPERLQRVVDYIEHNLSAPLCLEEMAQRACMSKYHFCRLFKRHVGLSPKQYCVCRRVELARQLLCRPDQSVTLIAFRLGFNDLTEFTRQFKKFTGFTPRAFRDSRCRIPSAR
jgi:AraC-like DNA-binding protein/CheY-like chemotaxis protein